MTHHQKRKLIYSAPTSKPLSWSRPVNVFESLESQSLTELIQAFSALYKIQGRHCKLPCFIPEHHPF